MDIYREPPPPGFRRCWFLNREPQLESRVLNERSRPSSMFLQFEWINERIIGILIIMLKLMSMK
jgi:hypothetical protein